MRDAITIGLGLFLAGCLKPVTLGATATSGGASGTSSGASSGTSGGASSSGSAAGTSGTTGGNACTQAGGQCYSGELVACPQGEIVNPFLTSACPPSALYTSCCVPGGGTTTTGAAGSTSGTASGSTTGGTSGGDGGCPSTCVAPAGSCSPHGECCPTFPPAGLGFYSTANDSACTQDCDCASGDCDPTLGVCAAQCSASNCASPNRCSTQGLCCPPLMEVPVGDQCQGDCDCGSLDCDMATGLCVPAGSPSQPSSQCAALGGVCAQGNACAGWPADATLYGCPSSGFESEFDSCCVSSDPGSGFEIPLPDGGPVDAQCAAYGGSCQADAGSCVPEYMVGAQFLCPVDGSGEGEYCCQPPREG